MGTSVIKYQVSSLQVNMSVDTVSHTGQKCLLASVHLMIKKIIIVFGYYSVYGEEKLSLSFPIQDVARSPNTGQWACDGVWRLRCSDFAQDWLTWGEGCPFVVWVRTRWLTGDLDPDGLGSVRDEAPGMS